ncbi:MOSC domain-containing protein [Halocynthiibacter sp. C4]|uniref:MOSC domain-containing protein n=1 Tax=Halocynthiibacter sp. C4 TaxID=2992758 RepID=UPI00237B915D|nr:MOSC domain-containing protein [Halocynthiibacter sp. C4]MDE0588691.1 MOSC domain-containing protein [Halocynthiibacter sp. C4]
MPALKATDFFCEIVWLGCVLDRNESLLATPMDEMELTFSGPLREDHGGLTRPSCSRVITQYPRGTEIRNVRQLTIVSAEEIKEIAKALELEQLDPALLGANMVVKGIPDFTAVPPSSRLQAENGATVTIDMENQPCNLVTREIGLKHEGEGKAFRAKAAGKRGVTAWVEREGTLRRGDKLRLHIPNQRPWPHG